MYGLLEIIDEWPKWSLFWTVLIQKEFTPEEFQGFWDDMTERKRFDYVSDLLARGDTAMYAKQIMEIL